MFPILQIGSLALQTPGLILLLGMWLGLDLAERQAPRFQLPPTQIFTTALVALAGGLIGGRLVFAATNIQVFYENPLNLFSISPQMISMAGGVLFAIASALAYGRRAGLPLWPTLDCLTSLLAVLQISANLANFASGDAYGLPTTLPWAIYLWGAMRHPTQIYETLSALIAAMITWPWAAARISRLYNQPGRRFWAFIAISASARLFLEAYRADSILIMNQFRQPQLIAWLVLALSLWQIARRVSPTRISAGSPI